MSDANENKTDWIAIEGAYRAGVLSVRAIARAHEITEGAIRKKAEKFGWLRDPSGTKRERVKAHFAGGEAPSTRAETQDAPRTQKDARPLRIVSGQGRTQQDAQEIAAEKLDTATNEDIADMDMALSNARECLRSISSFSRGAVDAKEIKTLLEANGLAIAQIRRIRGLDEPQAAAQVVSKAHRDAIVQAALGEDDG